LGGAVRFGMFAQRQAFQRGVTDEHRGAVVLTCREHAQLNPAAVWCGTPLTMEDYLKSDVVASPLRILDCDMPIDGAVALVLATADRAGDLPSSAVYIDSVGHASGPSLDAEVWSDMSTMSSRYAAEDLWKKTDLKPSDVDVAEIYDGFSSLALSWLEDLKFVHEGEAGPFLLEGRGRLGSDLPICTDGGQLGMGRLHGFGKVLEAVRQLRGECGPRQVPDAQVAVACSGGGVEASALLLTL
jgi:acetyl-CoA acetyltransferase